MSWAATEEDDEIHEQIMLRNTIRLDYNVTCSTYMRNTTEEEPPDQYACWKVISFSSILSSKTYYLKTKDILHFWLGSRQILRHKAFDLA